MPELDGRYDYYALMVVVAVVCVLLYRYLKKVHWLQDRLQVRKRVSRRAAARDSLARCSFAAVVAARRG